MSIPAFLAAIGLGSGAAAKGLPAAASNLGNFDQLMGGTMPQSGGNMFTNMAQQYTGQSAGGGSPEGTDWEAVLKNQMEMAEAERGRQFMAQNPGTEGAGMSQPNKPDVMGMGGLMQLATQGQRQPQARQRAPQYSNPYIQSLMG